MKKKIFIYGAGGHGKVVADIVQESGVIIDGFLDDDKSKIGKQILRYRILGNLSYIKNPHSCSLLLAIGDNSDRKRIYEKVRSMEIGIANAIHKRAYIAKSSKIGEGVVIMANAVINPDTVIENGTIVNTGATVDHDCHIGEFVHICPGVHVAGSVSIGSLSFIGIGTNIIQNISIGKDVTVGAGAVVISNLVDHVHAMGIPAKVTRLKAISV